MVRISIGNNSIFHNLIEILTYVLHIKTNGVLECQLAVVLDRKVSNLSFAGLPKGLGIIVLSNRVFAKDRRSAIADIFVCTVYIAIHQKLNVECTGFNFVTTAGNRVCEPSECATNEHRYTHQQRQCAHKQGALCRFSFCHITYDLLFSIVGVSANCTPSTPTNGCSLGFYLFKAVIYKPKK